MSVTVDEAGADALASLRTRPVPVMYLVIPASGQHPGLVLTMRGLPHATLKFENPDHVTAPPYPASLEGGVTVEGRAGEASVTGDPRLLSLFDHVMRSLSPAEENAA